MNTPKHSEEQRMKWREYAKVQRIRNGEKIKARERIAYAKNPKKALEYAAKYRKQHKEKLKNEAREYRKNNKDYVFNASVRKLEKNYNLTLEMYNAILKIQNHCCAICLKNLNNSKRKPDVDHNHNTGQVRGLLCTNCNTGIGMFKENIDFFNRALIYIDKYNTEEGKEFFEI